MQQFHFWGEKHWFFREELTYSKFNMDSTLDFIINKKWANQNSVLYLRWKQVSVIVTFHIISIKTMNLCPGGLGVCCSMHWESWLYTVALAVRREREKNARTWSRLWRGSHLTFPWHSIRGLLLHISALIVQCDWTKIVLCINCVGLFCHQLHFPLFDPELHLDAA